MAVRLVCRACGKRLKLPDGLSAKRSAKCPKCLAPVDLTAAREASAYLPASAPPGMATAPPANSQKAAPALLGEDDPLPYLAAPAVTVTKPAAPPKPAPPPKPVAPAGPPPLLGEDDPLPYLPKSPPPPTKEPSGSASAPLAKTTPANDEILSLDDDTSDGPAAEPVPFRVAARVLADSHSSAVGPCVAVLLPHGLFLEREPMKPFLYVPPGARVDSPAPGEITVALPEGRSLTVRFQARYARPLARDARAFLAGERPVPAAADYRRKWWMLWAALIFAMGLAGGPLVLARTADLGAEFGLHVGAGFALAGFVVNVAVVLFSRRPVPVQLIAMAGACVLVTGLFLFGASAYMAGRKSGIEQVRAETPPPVPPAAPAPAAPEPKPPEPPPDRPPSHIDRAKKNGTSALEDGPAEVTALALAPDGKTLGIGHADGTTNLWPFDQPTFDAMLPGPKADGPVTRVQFDTKGHFVFAYTANGVIGASRAAPAVAPAKLLGAPIAIAAEPDGDRVRFAAVRGNLVQHRVIASAFVRSPPKTKGYAVPGKGDEIVPMGNPPKDPNKPNGPTFLAWAPGDRLFAGLPDGGITIWSAAMRAEAPSRDHKAAVRAWAECSTTGDFATGDDQGNVGIWSAKGGKPTVTSVLATPVTGLAFSPSGARLAVTDGSGWLVIWDPVAAKAVHRVKRPTAVKAMAFGPGEDVIALAAGRTVEVWWLPELVK